VADGPADKNTRKQLCEKVFEAAEDIWGSLSSAQILKVNPRPTKKNPHQALDNVNALFDFLKDFAFNPKAGVPPPAGWAVGMSARPSNNGDFGRFDDIRVRPTSGTQQTIDRMQGGYFSKPQQTYVDGGKEKERMFLGVLTRTLNRLLNDEVMRKFLIVPNSKRKLDDAIVPGAAVSVQDTGERFLHLSQRAHWSPEMLAFAANLLDVNKQALENKFREWVMALH
jgi:hypothetical protein